MGSFTSRLLEENTELSIKVEKLTTFVVSKQFDDLPDIERNDLKQQLRHMKAYSTVIGRRVVRACN